MLVQRYDGPGDVAAAAANAVARWLTEPRGTVTLGLAGGGTPRATYETLLGEDVPWDRVDAWLADERWVPPDSSEANVRMARAALFDSVPARLHAVPYDLGDPAAAAAAYEATLQHIGAAPAPDVVLLGIGDDGHTASLFPGTAALAERERSYVANWVEAKGSWRVTATLPLLWAARRVVFLVTGAAKAEALADILERDRGLPAQQVAEGAADVTWFVDEAAASRLGNRGPRPH